MKSITQLLITLLLMFSSCERKPEDMHYPLVSDHPISAVAMKIRTSIGKQQNPAPSEPKDSLAVRVEFTSCYADNMLEIDDTEQVIVTVFGKDTLTMKAPQYHVRPTCYDRLIVFCLVRFPRSIEPVEKVLVEFVNRHGQRYHSTINYIPSRLHINEGDTIDLRSDSVDIFWEGLTPDFVDCNILEWGCAKFLAIPPFGNMFYDRAVFGLHHADRKFLRLKFTSFTPYSESSPRPTLVSATLTSTWDYIPTGDSRMYNRTGGDTYTDSTHVFIRFQ